MHYAICKRVFGLLDNCIIMHVEMAIKVKTDKLYSVFCKHFENLYVVDSIGVP